MTTPQYSGAGNRTTGNALQDISSATANSQLTSDSLVIDDVYQVTSLVPQELVNASSALADPRTGTPVDGQTAQSWNQRLYRYFLPKWRSPFRSGWVSPEGQYSVERDGPTSILRFRFESRKWMNRLSFEIAKVPCNWSVLYYDVDRDVMRELTDIPGNPVGGTVYPDSRSAYDRTLDKFRFDAQTAGYEKHTLEIPLLETNLIEFHINRNVLLDGYMGAVLRLVGSALHRVDPYSVALRNVDFTMMVRDYDDLPPIYDETVIIKSPLGHVEQLKVEEWQAPRAVDGNTATYWKCTPQPVGDAIVPLYLDVRDSAGAAQLIDQLSIDPMVTGPCMNVYYSNDAFAHTDFHLSRDRFDFENVGYVPMVPGSGADVTTVGQGLRISSNDQLRLDVSTDYTVGLSYFPHFGSASIPTALYVLYEMQLSASVVISLVYDSSVGRFSVRRNGTAMVEMTQPSFWLAGDQLSVVFSRTFGQRGLGAAWWLTVVRKDPVAAYDNVDPYDTLGTYDPPTNVPLVEVQDATPETSVLDSLTVGNDAAMAHPADGIIGDVWVRQEPFSNQVAQAFLNNTRGFMLKMGPDDRTRGDYNALLLAHLSSGLNGYIGPDHELYEMKVWTPVFRDFQLRRGITELPPTKCKYLKLEFSDLVAQPYPVQQERIVREVLTYPQWVHRFYEAVAVKNPTLADGKARGTYGYTYPASARLRDMAATGRAVFNRTVLLPFNRVLDPTHYLGAGTGASSPTNDSLGTPVQVTTWTHKKFFRTIRHEYDIRTIEQTYQQAYFVGIKEILVHRVDYLAGDDNPEYIETFGDLNHIESATMTIGGSTDRAYSTAAGQQVVSVTMPSFSNFKSLQIAAQASDYESQFDDAQMSLVTIDHITDFSGTVRTDVTGTLIGGSAGHVLQFSAVVDTTGDPYDTTGPYDSGQEYDSDAMPNGYGTITDGGLYQQVASGYIQYDDVDTYDSSAAYDAAFAVNIDAVRVSAVARIYMPDTALGTYTVMLWSGNNILARRDFKVAPHKFQELVLPYFTTGADTDLRVSISQTDPSINEPFALDFLGIFQNPLHWEVSNDGGTTWISVHEVINNPKAWVTFPTADHRLKVRVTALRAGAHVQTFMVVPWYIESPRMSKIPIDYITPAGINESDDLRSPEHKPLFQMWSRGFPQRYSLDQLGSVPITGHGITV